MWNDQGRSQYYPLRGEVELAQKDAERMAELDAQIQRHALSGGGIRLCDGCRCPLAAEHKSDLCKRCANREWMQRHRKPLSPEQRERKNLRRRESRAARRWTP
jgi:hypothetical protein